MTTQRLINSRKLTRRSFLALCLAGCSLTTRRLKWEGPAEETWALISDTHIDSSPDRSDHGSNMAANLARVVEDVVSAAPDRVLFNGDVAHAMGEQADYETFRSLTSPLWNAGTQVHLIPGNHDHRARFLESFPVATDASVPHKVVTIASVGGVDWLFLDSLVHTNAIRGSLGAKQRAWLARELDSNTAPAIICVHHNPEPSLVGLKDAEQLLNIIRPRRRVKAIFFGHTHVFRAWQEDGLHFVNLPATGYRLLNPDVPLGWVRASVGNNGIRLEFRGVTSLERTHGTTHSLPWRPEKGVRMILQA